MRVAPTPPPLKTAVPAETAEPLPMGVTLTVTLVMLVVFPGLSSLTSFISKQSVIGPPVPPGAFTLTANGLVAAALTSASSLDTVSVPVLLPFKNAALVLVNAAVIACAPAGTSTVYDVVAAPLEFTATAAPTGLPSTENCLCAPELNVSRASPITKRTAYTSYASRPALSAPCVCTSAAHFRCSS